MIAFLTKGLQVAGSFAGNLFRRGASSSVGHTITGGLSSGVNRVFNSGSPFGGQSQQQNTQEQQTAQPSVLSFEGLSRLGFSGAVRKLGIVLLLPQNLPLLLSLVVVLGVVGVFVLILFESGSVGAPAVISSPIGTGLLQ